MQKKQRCTKAETRNYKVKKNRDNKNEMHDTSFFPLAHLRSYTRTPSIGSLSRNHAYGPVHPKHLKHLEHLKE